MKLSIYYNQQNCKPAMNTYTWVGRWVLADEDEADKKDDSKNLRKYNIQK